LQQLEQRGFVERSILPDHERRHWLTPSKTNSPTMLSRFHAPAQRIVQLAQRYPGVIAVFGFASGLASYFLVERHEQFARGIAAAVLLSWLWLLIEPGLRSLLERRFGWRIPTVLLRLATQMIHQESLFFVLPFALTATAWNSGQAVFSLALLAAAAVALIDPWYHRWLGNRRWLFMSYHSFALFGVLFTALPLILRIPTGRSYALALGIAVVLAYPTVRGVVTVRSRWRQAVILFVLASVAWLGWVGRHWVPPATLWLTQGVVTRHVDTASREPGAAVHRITIAELRQGGLAAFTAIHAPLGLREHIHHLWLHQGREVDRIELDIHGGREEGYRAWSHKTNFSEDPTGQWQIRIMTDAGQMVGKLRFEVLP